MIELNAAPGLHRVQDVFVNWYVAEEGGRLTIVDAGIPGSWASLQELLGKLGRTGDDVDAVILTHAHLDHLGIAEKARRELGARVLIHPDDVRLTKHPLRYETERSPLRYLRYPQTLRTFGSVLAGRLLWSARIEQVDPFAPGDTLDVPGSPVVVPTPGHTNGHCSFHFPAADAVVAGDALVTKDPYTGREGPRLVARAATADSSRARGSLAALEATGAKTVLPGHGPVWTQGVELAVERARSAPVA